jgi:hypothetical protein
MSEMIKKVSAALAEAQARGFNGPEVLARVAISAMREPTIPMSNAGDREHRGVDDPDDTPRVWRAMIDAALR